MLGAGHEAARVHRGNQRHSGRLALVGHGQQPARKPRIAVLMLYADDDPQGQARAVAFLQGLESAGWIPGRNIAVDFLRGIFEPSWTRTIKAELLRLTPDVIVANSSIAARVAQSTAPTTPIIFVGVTEPVAQGFVATLSHPGGNMTGFSNYEPTLGAKWIGLLNDIAPQVKRAAFMYNPSNSGAKIPLESAQLAAQKFSIEVVDAPVADLAEIETVLNTLGHELRGALVLPNDVFTNTLRKPILELTVSYRLPVVSAIRSFVDEGGLLAYGVNLVSLFHRAGSHVDRILHREKPADIPVEQPTKFEMVINLKTATTLALTVPTNLLVSADEVIE
jgi:putative ABC transport system substrate-binding protein